MWGKKHINSDEYERLTKHLAECESSISTLRVRLDNQEIDNKMLRDKVLRKIQDGKSNPFNLESQDLNKPFSPFIK